MVTSKLNLEVDKLDICLEEISFQYFIYLKSIFLDGLDFFPGSQLQRSCKIRIDQGVAQLIILVRELDSRFSELGSFRNAKSLGEAAGSHVTYDYFKGYDLNALYSCLSVAQLLNEVCRNTFFFQNPEYMIGHFVVDNTFSYDGTFLDTVECSSIILVIHNQYIRIIS